MLRTTARSSSRSRPWPATRAASPRTPSSPTRRATTPRQRLSRQLEPEQPVLPRSDPAGQRPEHDQRHERDEDRDEELATRARGREQEHSAGRMAPRLVIRRDRQSHRPDHLLRVGRGRDRQHQAQSERRDHRAGTGTERAVQHDPTALRPDVHMAAHHRGPRRRRRPSTAASPSPLRATGCTAVSRSG